MQDVDLLDIDISPEVTVKVELPREPVSRSLNGNPSHIIPLPLPIVMVSAQDEGAVTSNKVNMVSKRVIFIVSLFLFSRSVAMFTAFDVVMVCLFPLADHGQHVYRVIG